MSTLWRHRTDVFEARGAVMNPSSWSLYPIIPPSEFARFLPTGLRLVMTAKSGSLESSSYLIGVGNDEGGWSNIFTGSGGGSSSGGIDRVEYVNFGTFSPFVVPVLDLSAVGVNVAVKSDTAASVTINVFLEGYYFPYQPDL